MAIWVPSVVNQGKETDASNTRNSARGYSSVSAAEEKDEVIWRQQDSGDDLELSVMGNTSDSELTEEMLLENLKVSHSLTHTYRFLHTIAASLVSFSLTLLNLSYSIFALLGFAGHVNKLCESFSDRNNTRGN